ncbi:MAG: alpha-2-macroglobulin family protein, partial [Planctomycetaceae bacterium]
VLQIRNPRGDVVEERNVTTDQWGGVDGTWRIPADAVLGSHSLVICGDVDRKDKPVIGSGTFQVEEYRKPEFEVTIEAPDEPVKLGDTISAAINARYYFGAPVTNAKVHYKVERTKKDSRWYPQTRWDWLYSAGYWWFAPDATWYPGWKQWGCFAPIPPWIGWSPDPPEVVAEGDAAVDEDGTFQVRIDTASALQQHSDSDHNYRITAQVTDQSRRTISAVGEVLVAREPFKVFVWTDRGHYQTGDTVTVDLQARTPDGSGVAGTGEAKLYEVQWNQDVAEEREVEAFEIMTSEDGSASFKMVIPRPGQYRVSCIVNDANGNAQHGGQLLYVRGPHDDGRGYRFNDLELILEKRDYRPGETAVLQINTNLADSTVLLFVRPVNGVCPRPQVIRLKGKSTTYDLKVGQEDMPNFYVEALTIADGRLHSMLKEIFVPPARKVAEVEVVTSQKEYRPGETAKVSLRLTDEDGRPFVGNTILTAYDASLEYIAASAVPEIREFFWNVRRHHDLRVSSTLQRVTGPLFRPGERPMQPLSDGSPTQLKGGAGGGRSLGREMMQRSGEMLMDAVAAPGMAMEASEGEAGAEATVEPAVRSSFADTALWLASVNSDAAGLVTAEFEVPDNLTTWKIKAWTLGEGTRVGAGTTEIICSKKLIIRPQTPRFFTQKDQITLSAIVHNYLDTDKDVEVVLETEGGQLRHLTASTQTIHIEAGGEARVDWPVQVVASGTATIRMKALTNEESDAAELTVPAQIHGLLKTESFAGVIRPGQDSAELQLTVPAARIEEQSRLEIRYSPSLAGAMVDALPFLIEYPYGCTEQTLNRFLPAVLTQNTLLGMGLNLEEIRRKRTNLNAQEIGDPAQRTQRWNRNNPNPVFDTGEMNKIVRDGVRALTEMQLSDGGWGWFSGYGEYSS